MAAIETTMAAAAQKLEAMRDRAAEPSTVHLGMPDLRRDASVRAAVRSRPSAVCTSSARKSRASNSSSRSTVSMKRERLSTAVAGRVAQYNARTFGTQPAGRL
ncbi:hypothetical protein ACWGAN_34200 [Streptomyces sp. NPDC054945]